MIACIFPEYDVSFTSYVVINVEWIAYFVFVAILKSDILLRIALSKAKSGEKSDSQYFISHTFIT